MRPPLLTLSAALAALVGLTMHGCGAPSTRAAAPGAALSGAPDARDLSSTSTAEPDAASGAWARSASNSPSGADTFDAAWRLVLDTHFDPAKLDPSQGGVDWVAVREELMPRAAAAADPDELRAVIDEMLGRLTQSHFAVIPGSLPGGTVAASDGRGVNAAPTAKASAAPATRPDLLPDRAAPSEGGEGTLGIDVRVVRGEALVTAVEPGLPAHEQGVRPGWVVEAVDDAPVGDAIAAIGAGFAGQGAPPGPWQAYVETRAVLDMLGGRQGERRELILRDGADRPVHLAAELVAPTGERFRLGALPEQHVRFSARRLERREIEEALGGGSAELSAADLRIGLIQFNMWLTPVVEPFHAAIERFGADDGVIIDLRGNPGGIGLMAMTLAGDLCDRPITLGTLRTRGATHEFRANPRRLASDGRRVQPYDGPVAVLVDQMTGSTSEVFAGGLQSQGRVRVFGTATVGAALPAQMSTLPNGDTLLHAVADFTTADGTRLEGRGVLPDVETPLRREELLAGCDAALLAAVRWIAAEARGLDLQ